MSRSEYLDQTERFVEYLETKRKQAGLMQKQLADLGGISHSYYTKLIGLKRARINYGDESKQVTAPLRPDGLRGVLQTLSDRLGEDCVTEGLRLWGHYHPESEPKEVRDQAERQLVELILRMQRLSPDKLKTVETLVEHLIE